MTQSDISTVVMAKQDRVYEALFHMRGDLLKRVKTLDANYLNFG